MQHTFKKKRRQKSAIKIQCGWTLTGVRREGANIPFCCHTHQPYRRRCAQRNIVNYITTQQRLRQQCELHDGHIVPPLQISHLVTWVKYLIKLSLSLFALDLQ